MNELVLLRPAALFLLLLPVLLLVLTRVLSGSTRRATGSLAVWRLVGGETAVAARRTRHRVPPATWLWVLALVLGTLALSGPRRVAAAQARTWTAVVDRRPGMYLPWASKGSETRLDRALASALEHLLAAGRTGDRVRWKSAEREDLVLPLGERPPAVWLGRDPHWAPRPPFEANDLPGTLWITDRGSGPGPGGGDLESPSRAGLFASGGAAQPGPIGERYRDGVLVVWDGEQGASELPAPPRELRLELPRDSSALARGLFVDLVESYAAARRLELAEDRAAGGGPPPALVVRVGVEGTERLVAARDGWQLEVVAGAPPALASRGADAPARASVRTWLAAGRGSGTRALVRYAPGVVAVGLHPVAEPQGDPAAFAASWAQLFDEALLPREGAVPLASRLAAGPRVERPGADPSSEDGGVERLALDAWLAAAAALVALAAVLVRCRDTQQQNP